jgi:hypothetical protein
MNKITAEHLARDAYVYVRQSTADQLLNNPESRRRQYALVERARSLGWENVIVVDDDLGRSGSGQRRPGFERLLAAICAGTVGAVLAIEASRLARNGRDWHTLLEFCAFVMGRVQLAARCLQTQRLSRTLPEHRQLEVAEGAFQSK